LAGTMTFGARTPTAADLAIEGEVNEAAVRANARFDGGTGGWRSGRSDLTVSLEAASTGKVTQLLVATGLARRRPPGATPGRILIRASGIPSEGLATVASLEGGEVGLSFRGQVRLAETGARAEGDLEVRAGNATPLAALAGLAPPLRVDGLPVSGKLKLV